MRRIVLRLVGFGGVLTLVYFLGPKPTSFDSIPAIPAYVMSEVAKHANVESWIKELESHKGIRPGNESEFFGQILQGNLRSLSCFICMDFLPAQWKDIR